MIDLAPQASLTIAAGVEPGEDRLGGFSAVDLFNRIEVIEAKKKKRSDLKSKK